MIARNKMLWRPGTAGAERSRICFIPPRVLRLVYCRAYRKRGSPMLIEAAPELALRTARPEDSAICEKICYDAFSTINSAHGFPCDFPSPEHAVGLLTKMFSSPGLYCVVAQSDGQILGSNCMDERSTIYGIGPITVHPGAQNKGIGRKLMHAVMERAWGRGALESGWCRQRFIVAPFRSIPRLDSKFVSRWPACRDARRSAVSPVAPCVRPHPPMRKLATNCPGGFTDTNGLPS